MITQNKTNIKSKEVKRQDSIATRIKHLLEVKLMMLAKILSDKSEKLNRKVKTALLFSFCFVFGSTSVYIVFKSFQPGSYKINNEEIRTPLVANKPDSISFEKNTVTIAERDLERIERFKTYMDSLKKTEYGKSLYDSIMNNRKGLLDSISQLNQLYNLK
jgi:hypothetical protein